MGLAISPKCTPSSSVLRTLNLQHPDQGEKMENSQIVLKEKLEVSGILKEALKIPLKCPKFIILVLLTSLPMFCIMLLHEFILQNTMVETKAFLTPPPPPNGLLSGDFYIISYTQWEYWSYGSPLGITIRLVQNMSPRLLQLGILYLVPLHLLDLLNTITTLHSASAIYSGDTSSVTVVDMLYGSLIKTSFKGALITSIYVLFLNSFTLLALIWAGTNSIFTFPFFMVVYGVGSVVLFVKWMDWSAVWNLSIVFSVLEEEGEEKHGIEAFWAALYFSRGSRKRGLCLMLVFFVWRTGLRLLCLYVGGYEKWAGLVATSAMSCLGNVLKWVVCMVYFYDCKARILEKKMDVEEGGEKKNGAL